MSAKKILIATLLAGATALPMSSANAFFGGWWPWNWDDDYYHHYPYWGGYPGYYGGYPGYWGGYPGYYGGYPGYYGGYPGYWGGYNGWGPWY